MKLPLILILLLGLSPQAFAHGTVTVLYSIGGSSFILVMGFVALGFVRAERANKIKALLTLLLGAGGIVATASLPDYEQNHWMIDGAMISVAILSFGLSMWLQIGNRQRKSDEGPGAN